MSIEEKLLKKLFGINGELSTTGESDFDFQTLTNGYVMIKLNGTKAELYTSNEWDYCLEEVKELSGEEVKALKNEGYTW